MEYGLYSNDELASLSENFVCVRSYVGVAGTNEMLKQYGIVGTRGIGPWVQGNNLDFVFFSPNLKPLTHQELKEVTPKPTEESQNSIRWVYTVPGARSRDESAGVVIGAMKKILKQYPPKDKETIHIPWALNAESALHFASYEDRRIVLVPSANGAVSRKLADSLSYPALLRKHVHNYVFLKVEGNLPDELRAARTQAGPHGLVIVERPGERVRGDTPCAVKSSDFQRLFVRGIERRPAQDLHRWGRPGGKRRAKGRHMRAVLNLLPPFLRRLRWHEVMPLLLALIIIGAAYLFLELADEVGEGETQRFDEWVVRSLRRADDPALPVGPPWLREAGLDATALGSFLVLALLAAAVAGFMLLTGERGLALLTVVATAGGAVVNGMLKEVIQRERPQVVPHLREVMTPSFPSGHAMLSATVYLTLGILLTRSVPGRWAKLYCLGWALALTLLVGLSRVYLGVHYPTDVLAGWLAGLAWALLCWVIAQYLQHRGAVEEPTAEVHK